MNNNNNNHNNHNQDGNYHGAAGRPVAAALGVVIHAPPAVNNININQQEVQEIDRLTVADLEAGFALISPWDLPAVTSEDDRNFAMYVFASIFSLGRRQRLQEPFGQTDRIRILTCCLLALSGGSAGTMAARRRHQQQRLSRECRLPFILLLLGALLRSGAPVSLIHFILHFPTFRSNLLRLVLPAIQYADEDLQELYQQFTHLGFLGQTMASVLVGRILNDVSDQERHNFELSLIGFAMYHDTDPNVIRDAFFRLVEDTGLSNRYSCCLFLDPNENRGIPWSHIRLRTVSMLCRDVLSTTTTNEDEEEETASSTRYHVDAVHRILLKLYETSPDVDRIQLLLNHQRTKTSSAQSKPCGDVHEGSRKRSRLEMEQESSLMVNSLDCMMEAQAVVSGISNNSQKLRISDEHISPLYLALRYDPTQISRLSAMDLGSNRRRRRLGGYHQQQWSWCTIL